MIGARDLHQRMIDRLVAQRVIRNPAVEEAFRRVPRHIFLPKASLEHVYSGDAIPIRRRQDGLPISSSGDVNMTATMLEQLMVRKGQRPLEIGTGSGYNAALLAAIVGSEGTTVTVDIEKDIVQEACERLVAAGITQVNTVCGDGWLAVPNWAPYDRVEVTVGAWDVSPHGVSQLIEGGILVVPLWLRAGMQLSIAFIKQREELRSTSIVGTGFMQLRGPHAGPEGYVRPNGWTALLDDQSVETICLIRDLLARPAHRLPASDLPPGWHRRMLLLAQDAILLIDSENWHHRLMGVYRRKPSGLAVIEIGAKDHPNEILLFGEPTCSNLLVPWMSKQPPLDYSRLHILAVPSDNSQEIGGPNCVEVRRPGFRFLLIEGEQPH